MESAGWRTVVIDTHAELALKEGCLILRGTETVSIPLSQIQTVIVSAAGGTISLPLLAALAERGIPFITCNGKKEPVGELTGFSCHSSAAGRMLRQAGWTVPGKAAVWKQIVENKIANQRGVLRLSEAAKLCVCKADQKCGGYAGRPAGSGRTGARNGKRVCPAADLARL